MEYLVFRLYGPMASWGEIAVGESRHSANYPSKSAIIGLLGAALGIRREEESKQQALISQYHQAVKVFSPGSILKDYHTAQAPDSVGKFKYRTRRDELVIGRDRLGTILSSREYRTDAHAVVALRANVDALFSLEELNQALVEPKFQLYLGRKSCPLGAPLAGKIVRAEGFRIALDTYSPGELPIGSPAWSIDSRWLPSANLTYYYWEGDISDFSDSTESFDHRSVQTRVRHDSPVSRDRWQFRSRAEHLWCHARECK